MSEEETIDVKIIVTEGKKSTEKIVEGKLKKNV